VITLAQFSDLVELVNQVSDALEGAVELEDFQRLGFADEPIDEISSDENLENEDKYKWLFDAASDLK
jgi:hypothetical protein